MDEMVCVRISDEFVNIQAICQMAFIVLFLGWFAQHIFECCRDPFCEGLRKKLEKLEQELEETGTALHLALDQLEIAEQTIYNQEENFESNKRKRTDSDSSSSCERRTKQRTD
jgi:hypothetical protein